MININVLTYLDYNIFDYQLDKKKFAKDFCFYENSSLDIRWDMVVVFEDISRTHNIRCKKGGLIFISAEPPISSVYSNRFLKQFDIIYSVHPGVKRLKKIHFPYQYFYDWHFGKNPKLQTYKFSFDEILKLEIPIKTKNISVITSSQAKFPLHLKRLEFIEELKKTFDGQIDFFGRGSNEIVYKSDGILPYRFHICIENQCLDNYWTEKFADPLIGYSIPIYCGCTNMDTFFNKDSFISLNINDINKSKELIASILEDPINIYNDKMSKLKLARNLLINEYNIFPTLACLYKSNQANLSDFQKIIIKPNHLFPEHSLLNYNLRFKRYFLKKINTIIIKVK